ncbi:hypothetical protein RJ55_02903 [Drechmeria coniospora]|nr:hypothetical protein RJ55_02903 [Drechmeria coniospora]
MVPRQHAVRPASMPSADEPVGSRWTGWTKRGTRHRATIPQAPLHAYMAARSAPYGTRHIALAHSHCTKDLHLQVTAQGSSSMLSFSSRNFAIASTTVQRGRLCGVVLTIHARPPNTEHCGLTPEPAGLLLVNKHKYLVRSTLHRHELGNYKYNYGVLYITPYCGALATTSTAAVPNGVPEVHGQGKGRLGHPSMNEHRVGLLRTSNGQHGLHVHVPGPTKYGPSGRCRGGSTGHPEELLAGTVLFLRSRAWCIATDGPRNYLVLAASPLVLGAAPALHASSPDLSRARLGKQCKYVCRRLAASVKQLTCRA